DLEGSDDVLLDTGGVIVGSGVTSHIRVNVNEATASIGAGAQVTTVGDVDLQTRSQAVLTTEPTVHTYGLAAAGAVDSKVSVDNSNQVLIGDNATVTALGDINLLAGRDRSGARNFFQLTSHGDALNATAIPITLLKSHVGLQQTHTVSVGSGAS